MEENEKQSLEKGFIIGEDFSADDEDILKAKKNMAKKRKKSNKKNAVKSIVWIISIIAVSLALAFGIIFVGADYMGIGFGRGDDCVVEIEKGASTAQIATALKDCGAVKCPLVFRVYSRLKGYDGKFKFGVYTFNNESGYDILAEMLMNDGAAADSVTVKVPDGATIDELAELFEQKGVCTADDFLNEVQNGEFDYDFVDEIPADNVRYRLEGYLFPDTYEFYNYDSAECAHLAVDKMLNEMNNVLKPLESKISSSEYSLHEIMTVASIVELESAVSNEDAPKVAAVFYNRLKSASFPTLGSSPTLKTRYNHGDDRYNTYVCKGLPVGPLCSCTKATVNAAVNPAQDFDYYYFVTDKSMKFYYTKTLAQHNATIAKLKKENNWLYEVID